MAYDINIKIATLDQQVSGKFISFNDLKTVKVDGLQKLMNIFTKYFLTPIGTNPIDKNEGTEVPALLGSNISPFDARDIVVLAINKTVTAVRRLQQNQNLSSAERLLNATLTDFIAQPDRPGFTAQILLRNVANQGATLFIPSLSVG